MVEPLSNTLIRMCAFTDIYISNKVRLWTALSSILLLFRPFFASRWIAHLLVVSSFPNLLFIAIAYDINETSENLDFYILHSNFNFSSLFSDFHILQTSTELDTLSWI